MPSPRYNDARQFGLSLDEETPRTQAVEDVLLSQGYKICPICGTPSHRNATMCSTCGTSLSEVEVVSEKRQRTSQSSTEKTANSRYDRRYGETDLLEGELHRRSEVYIFGGALVLLAVVCVGVIAFAGARWLLPAAADTPTPNPIATQPVIVLETNTPPPTPVLATVTPPPPTATNTPTPGPCTHRVATGDDLISIAWDCGHRSLDVMPLILELNNLTSPEMIQVGQEIMVPWPTEEGAPTEPPQEDASDELGGATTDEAGDIFSEDSAQALPGLELASVPTQGTPTIAPTETLLPGIEYYTVQPNENILSIVYSYNTSVQVLSQLNPEITFSQCEFGSPVGGPECSVMIYAGQQIRVPAPTPTPSLSPTRSGSETPTPTATPTFNAPSAISPADRTLFVRGDLITLRWVGTGTLSEGETYRVRVEDLTTGQVHTSDTTDLSFILPSDWQGQDGQRHDYRWSISVIRSDDPDRPLYTTEPRLFTWEGR